MTTTAAQAPGEHTYPASTIVTMQLGLALSLMLGLMFFSGGLFYLYVFNYDVGPYFTITRFIHFYVGLASIPFLLAKYGSTGFRFAGYYLRLPRFKAAGPPRLIPRIFSPLLALDFFVLYFSGLYMLFHYYYTVTNVPPGFKPVQLHLWAALIAVPLIAIHLGSHLLEATQGLAEERRALLKTERVSPEANRRTLTRRAFMSTVLAGGVGLALAYQNTSLVNKSIAGLFIGRIPKEERGGPGDFPVETLFGKKDVDLSQWQLVIKGAVQNETSLTYEELLAMPVTTKQIRISCVSGWTAQPTWSGPLVRDVLAKAGVNPDAKSVNFHSVSGYGLTWHAHLLTGDDAILATHVNGAPLSNNHGFPVRLIVPGYPGQNMVKQIDRITVAIEKEKVDPDYKLVLNNRQDYDRLRARVEGSV
ncbi:MAG: molybdopterin-dependent oxidoreductase [Chloroflexota bacterium]